MTTNSILLILFFALLLTFIFFVLPRLLKKLGNQKGTREEAIKLGMTVEEVREGAPTFSQTAEPIKPAGNQSIYRYSLKRSGASPSHWSILPRLLLGGAVYPESWLLYEGVRYPPEIWFLVIKDGNPSEGLTNFVKQLAGAWTEEYLEFDGTPTEVRAYWHEWGGAGQAKIIYDYLTILQQY
jgi:hypothetical protein